MLCYIAVVVCLLSGPATDDKNCFDCLFLVSTEEDTIKHLTMFKIEKVKVVLRLTQLKQNETKRKCNKARLYKI